MRFYSSLTLLLASSLTVNGLRIPNLDSALPRRDLELEAELIPAPLVERFDASLIHDLEKRRGGGGSSGGGSSGGSSGGGGGGGGRSGGSSSGSGSSGTSGSSSAGGRSGSGGGAAPSYGGGRYYGGGATAPYSAGTRSPRGVAPYFLGGAALGIFPGLWLYGAYAYPYSHPYSFRNQTAANSTNPNGVNETLPVTCLCQQYNPCGCDDNNNSTFLDSIIGNGSAADTDDSLVQIAPVNGTKTIILNGTLPNDTIAAGGTSTSTNMGQTFLESSGYWLMVATVGWTVWLL